MDLKAYQRSYYRKKEAKICVSCTEAAEEGKVLCPKHHKMQKRRDKERKDSGKCRRCDSQAVPDRTLCIDHADQLKRQRDVITKRVIQAYGGMCACCGEDFLPFLGIDHVEGDGAKHRQEIQTPSGNPFYAWLDKNKYPSGFQVLCHNCNRLKGTGPMCGCPYRIGKENDTSMKIIALDAESHPIKPGMVCPRPVCMSWTDDGENIHLVDRAEGLCLLLLWLRDPNIMLVGWNLPFDLSIFAAEDPDLFLPLIFAAYDAGRLRDGMVRQTLIDISEGQHKYRTAIIGEKKGEHVKTDYKLASVVKHYFGRDLEKAGETPEDPGYWRTRYGLLDGTPINQWPKPAVEYANNDALEHWNVWGEMQRYVEENHGRTDGMPDEVRQNQHAWALRLVGIWGLRTEATAVADLRKYTEKALGEIVENLKKLGFVRLDGSRDMEKIKAAVEAAYVAKGGKAPRTAKDGVSTSEETLMESGDPNLELLASTSTLRTDMTRYIPMLETGITVPMNPGWISCVETGRVACREPNWMNLPKVGKTRNCAVPRPGFLYAGCDYDAAELRSWCQVCIDLGFGSTMNEAIKAGIDLHLRVAAGLLSIPFEEATQRYQDGDEILDLMRNLSKIENFGLIGGMGAKRLLAAIQENKKLLAEIEKAGIKVNLAFTKEAIQKWKGTWLEAEKYLDSMAAAVDQNGETNIEQLRSGRRRGRVGYSDGANGYFQGLTADGAKAALYAVVRECYLKELNSPLFGSRVVLFLHDEIIIEAPEAKADAAAKRLAEVMIAEMQEWLPDVPVSATPTLSRRWYKGSKPAFADGKLVPGRPEKKDGKTKWVHDTGEERMAA